MAENLEPLEPEVKRIKREDNSMGTNVLLSDAQDAAAVNEKRTVFVWDMDETLILLKSLLDGTYGKSCDGAKDIEKGVEIGKCWEKHILQVCDEYFFYEQIEEFNEPFVDSLSEYDDGRDLSAYDFSKDGFSQPCDDANKRKLAYRYRVIAQKYAQVLGLHCVLDQETLKLWDDLYDLTDDFTDKWLSSARALLEQCLEGDFFSSSASFHSSSTTSSCHKKGEKVNVLVTSGSLVPSLVKCLLFRLNGSIPYDNVYSSWDVGKLQCFSWIKERFGSTASQFCVIGNGSEECEAAKAMGWPFVMIDLQPGCWHRFPGLSLKTIKQYIDVVYPEETKDES
ncbi:eyes absent homolog 2 isoform X1 [Amborella trichopoda]|uniref:eyes absent homolog 2 isoform X1 n=2 Tax=Amborella trichopoda TaxID=13333 RepID=UPI0009C14484|nr:eyes absent homolog 2 isoform X1 [Amborella trichopoda]|eukprot:XP_020524855.1 eyes absent homolog 2 isoform X1 [Amborella trichopoda]